MNTKDTMTLRHNLLSNVVELHFNNEEVKNFLSSLPTHTRTWNSNKRCWVIVPEVLHKVVSYSRHTFSRIDASSIPIKYQKVVQRALQGLSQTKSTYPVDNSPYDVLHITRDAPDCVVKAVYKALAFEHHPDRGGNSEEFQKVKEAYEAIIKGP